MTTVDVGGRGTVSACKVCGRNEALSSEDAVRRTPSFHPRTPLACCLSKQKGPETVQDKHTESTAHPGAEVRTADLQTPVHSTRNFKVETRSDGA